MSEPIPKGFKVVRQQEIPEGFSVVSVPRTQFQSESEIPVMGESDLPFAPKPQQLSATIPEMVIGGGEAALSTATGMTGGAFGYVTGVLDQLSRELVSGKIGSQESAKRVQQAAQELARANTYEPRSEVGKEYVQNIGEAAEALTPIAPQLAELQMLKPNIPRVKRPTNKEAMTDKLMSGSTDIDTAGWILKDKKGNPIHIDEQPLKLPKGVKGVKDPTGIAVIGQGFDKGLIPVIRESSFGSTNQMRRMTKIAENMTKNLKVKTMQSPLDVVGESLFKRFEAIHKINKKSGREVRKAANDLKGVALTDAELQGMYGNFKSRLEDIGAVIDDTNGFKVSYAEGSPMTSSYLGKARSSIEKLVSTLAMDKKRPDAFRLHQLKKTLDEVINWDKKKADPEVAGEVESLVKATRGDINELLRSKSDNYRKANIKASETFGFIDSGRKILKETVDMNDPRLIEKIGLQMRKLNSNYASKNNILNLIDDADTLSKKYGANFDDNIVDLAIFGSNLGKRFRLDGDNTFKALTTQAELDAFTVSGNVRKGYEAIKSVWKNDEIAFKTLNKYLNEQRQAKKQKEK